MTTEIYYVDTNQQYLTYGIITLIVLLLLLWYFIKTSIGLDNYDYAKGKKDNFISRRLDPNSPDYVQQTFLDPDQRLTNALFKKEILIENNSPTEHGWYGGVPLNFMTPSDVKISPLWRGKYKSINVMNNRTWWQDRYFTKYPENTPLSNDTQTIKYYGPNHYITNKKKEQGNCTKLRVERYAK